MDEKDEFTLQLERYRRWIQPIAEEHLRAAFQMFLDDLLDPSARPNPPMSEEWLPISHPEYGQLAAMAIRNVVEAITERELCNVIMRLTGRVD